jgi:translation initiation factor 3 subunit D
VVAAVLMCSTKSNYAWDVEIKKFENKIFIDKRQDDPENNILNFQTQDETSLDHQPFDDQTINGIKPLMQEAQRINNSWLNQCQSEDQTKVIQYEGENPFLEDENQVATRVGYVYKIWKLQDENPAEGLKQKKICIRCAVHTNTGQLKENGERVLMNVYALNEHSLERSNWKGTIDNSIVPCLNAEVSNNSFRVSRYLVQSILADVDYMKFAFVSRKNMASNKEHVVMATHTVKTLAWANQSNMSMDRMWCIIKRIVEEVEEAKVEGEEEDGMGEFVLLKDFQKVEFRLYKKNEEDEEEEQEEEQEEK